jgi:hypothetical protein
MVNQVPPCNKEPCRSQPTPRLGKIPAGDANETVSQTPVDLRSAPPKKAYTKVSPKFFVSFVESLSKNKDKSRALVSKGKNSDQKKNLDISNPQNPPAKSGEARKKATLVDDKDFPGEFLMPIAELLMSPAKPEASKKLKYSESDADSPKPYIAPYGDYLYSCFYCKSSDHHSEGCRKRREDGVGPDCCYYCKKFGHYARNCPKKNGVCFYCKKPGHGVANC